MGLQIELVEKLEFAATAKPKSSLPKLAAPPCYKRKAPHTFFLSFPGTSGLLLVADFTCPFPSKWQYPLSSPPQTPWPWVEHKPPVTHLPFMEAWSWLMRRFNFRVCPRRGESVCREEWGLLWWGAPASARRCWRLFCRIVSLSWRQVAR